MPAVLYGHNQETTVLELKEKEFAKIFKQAGESTIIHLDIEGKSLPVLIQDVQHHYLKDHPIHVDFYAVNMTETLKATVPLHFVGEAPAVKAMGGILIKNLSEVEVECLPGDLPSNIEVDVSVLEDFEKAIRVSDLQVSDQVRVLAAPDELIVTVTAPRSEEELAALEEKPVAVDVTQVEGVVKPEKSDEVSGATNTTEEEAK